MTLTEELERLARLHAEGHLSADEFARAKARLVEPPTVARSLGQSLNALRRSRNDRWLGGVCGGMAELSQVAAWIWRLGFLLLLCFGGTGLVIYALMWLLVPVADPSAPPSPRVVHGA